jgi:hypothetical protein
MVPERGHQRRLDDDHHLRIAVQQFDVSSGRLRRARGLEEMDDVSVFDAASVIDADRAVDRDASR